MPLLKDPMAILAFCTGVCALVFWSATRPWGARFFRVIPSIIFIYYIPTFATTFGVIPSASPAYVWMRDYLLPFSLFILMVTADVSSILKIGPGAIVIMLIGTLGVVVGGPIAFLLFKPWLPPEAWKGMAALSGSWIGGGANFAAIKESVAAPDSIIGPIIIVDTAVGYTWMGVLFFLANYQRLFDRWNRASSSVFDDLNRRLQDFEQSRIKPITIADVSVVLGVGFLGGVACKELGAWLHQVSHPWLATAAPQLAEILSNFTWMVILITTLGILFSFTPLRNIETGGASKLGYAGLFLFLTSIGAKADLRGILSAPALVLAATLWLLIHICFMFAGARLLKVPMFLVAVGSQANIGGAASAPVVAAAYYKAMAPVGLLLGVLGYLVGNYAGLLCAFLLKLASG